MAKAELKGYLSLNSTRFGKGLDKAKKGLKKFAIGGSASMAVVSAAAIATANVFWDITKASAAAGAEWQRLSDMSGITAEELSLYSVVLKELNVDQDQFIDITKKTSEMLVDAGMGASGALEKLELLGLTYDGLRDKSPIQQFEAVMNSMRNMKDETQALGVAEIAFGDAGSALLPLFKKKQSEIDAMKLKSRQLGQVWDEHGTAKAKKLHTALGELGLAWDGIKNEAALVFMGEAGEGISNLTEEIQRLIEDGDISDFIVATGYMTSELFGTVMQGFYFVQHKAQIFFHYLDATVKTVVGGILYYSGIMFRPLFSAVTEAIDFVIGLYNRLPWIDDDEELDLIGEKFMEGHDKGSKKMKAMMDQGMEYFDPVYKEEIDKDYELKTGRVDKISTVMNDFMNKVESREKVRVSNRQEKLTEQRVNLGIQQRFEQGNSVRLPKMVNFEEMRKLVAETQKTNEFLEQQFDLMNQPRKAFK